MGKLFFDGCFRVNFHSSVFFKVFYFGVLVLILVSLTFDLFIQIERISIHLSLYFYSSVIETCLWVVFKPGIYICSSNNLEEGRSEGADWVFILVYINILF